jgi:hypothetical protein
MVQLNDHTPSSDLLMTLLQQPPEKSKEIPPDKPGGEAKQPPAKTEEKTAPTKDVPAKTSQDEPPGKDVVAPPGVQPQDIPAQLPPGARIAVPAKDQPKNFQIGSILQPALLLILVLAVGAILIAWLKKNRDRTTGTVALSANDQLTAFRESMEQGDMTDEEFKKVKLLLAEKLRKPGSPVASATAPAPTPKPTENQP